MLAAVQSPDEQLIAPGYLMQIIAASQHPALFVSYNTSHHTLRMSQREFHLC